MGFFFISGKINISLFNNFQNHTPAPIKISYLLNAVKFETGKHAPAENVNDSNLYEPTPYKLPRGEINIDALLRFVIQLLAAGISEYGTTISDDPAPSCFSVIDTLDFPAVDF